MSRAALFIAAALAAGVITARPAAAEPVTLTVFEDFMASPSIQARIAELYGVVVPNPKAIDFVKPENRASVRIGTDDFYRPELLWQPLAKRTRGGYQQLWAAALKAAGRDVKHPTP